MKEIEKLYNKLVKRPGNFDIDRRAFLAGGRVALEWAMTRKLCSDEGWYIPPDVIEKELEE